MISTRTRPVVYTAQSKAFFYCRDAICEFVFSMGCVPLNPFRVFDYFLGDRVRRDLVREGNNNLIRIADEVWVFGHLISNGVLFEIRYAGELGKKVRFFTVDNKPSGIKEIQTSRLKFEPELHSQTRMSRNQLLEYMTLFRDEDTDDDGEMQLSLF
jgi:hypothetical protein